MEAALNQGRLYYRQLTGPDLDAAFNLFRAMDRNGDNRVSVNEVIAFMAERGMPNADTCRVLAEGMGLAGNRYLNMEDVVAFGYAFLKWPSCHRCGSIIFDLYYTCMQCHNMCTNGQGADTYDLCAMCFNTGNFQQGHGPFQQSFPGGGQGPDMSYNQGLPGMTTRFHGGGQGPTMSFNQGFQGIHGRWQGPATSYNPGLPGMTTSFHGGGQGPAMSFNQGLQGIHGGWQGPAMSNNQGLPGMTTSFHGGGQGPAMSYNQGLPGMTTSFHRGGQGEGTRNFSKQKILQILANLSSVGAAVGTAATVGCSIM